MYPLVRERAVDEIPVSVTCRVLKIARQPFYRWLKEPATDREWAQAQLTNAIVDAHRDDPGFGYRLMPDEVRAPGIVVSNRTLWARCSQMQIWSVFGKKRNGKVSAAGPPAFDDHVLGVFTADAPNSVGWSTSRSTARAKASSTSARSRTCSATGSPATRSTRG